MFLRVDLNSAVDPVSKEILAENRIVEAAASVIELDSSKVVVASHQGRVGGYDFISLKKHAEVLARSIGKEVRFIEDVCGPTARKEISALRRGEVLLLDNLRLMSEENSEYTLEDAAKTIFVQRLHKLFDACVVDAFATAHRAHPSMIGFSDLMPMCAGRLVEKELSGLNRVLQESRRPFTIVLGGAKVKDRLDSIGSLISGGRADKILLSGLIGNLFLRASSISLAYSGGDEFLDRARVLMREHPGVFELPRDLAVERRGERVELASRDLESGDRIMDIGSKTLTDYANIMRASGTLLMSGPPGAFEKKGFEIGTEALLKAAASSSASSIISGGHLGAASARLGLTGKFGHVSTAGGALVKFVAGKRLPLVEALARSVEKYEGKKS